MIKKRLTLNKKKITFVKFGYDKKRLTLNKKKITFVNLHKNRLIHISKKNEAVIFE